MPMGGGDQYRSDDDVAQRGDDDMDDSLRDDFYHAPPYAGLPFVAGGASGAQRWIVDGVMARGETSLLIAPPFAGKSVLAAHLAHHVARGAHWFGRAATPGGVLIIAGERAREQQRRITALDNETGEAAVLIANGSGMDLRRTDAVPRMRATLDAARERVGDIGLIIIDTLASLCTGADENSAADQTRAMAALAAVRDHADAHLCVLHHSPKSDPRASRGHGSVEGAADLVISVDRPNGRHRWRVVAANALAEPFPTAEFTIGSHDGPDWSAAIVRSASADLSPRDAAVLAGLRKAGEAINVAEFIRTIVDEALPAEGDAKRKACERALEALNAAGLVLITGTGRARLVRAAP